MMKVGSPTAMLMPLPKLLPETAPGVANPCGNEIGPPLPVGPQLGVVASWPTPRMQVGFAPKSISSVGLNSKKPPMNGVQMKSTPVLKVCLPIVLAMSSLNWYFRWIEFCGTLVLVPNCASGKVINGTLVVLSIRLFQYWKPNVNWLIKVGEKVELTVRLATCKWFTVKLPSVKSMVPSLWSFRLSLAWVVTER